MVERRVPQERKKEDLSNVGAVLTTCNDLITRINSGEVSLDLPTLPQGVTYKFSHALFGHGRTGYGSEYDSFYRDGDFGFALGVDRPDNPPLWLAVCGFMSEERLMDKRGDTMSLRKDPTSPVIVQLQGFTKDTFEDPQRLRDAKRLISRVPWDEALFQVVNRWAEEMNFSQVSILPGAHNFWLGDGYATLEKLEKRYDAFALAHGFHRDQEDELYRKRLPTKKNAKKLSTSHIIDSPPLVLYTE